MIVQCLVFRAIQESARIQTVHRNEVAPVLPAIREIESRVGAAEGAIGCGHASMRLGVSESRPCSGHNHQTGFAAIFGWGSALYHFQRLYRIDRKLIGEDLALLVGNRLAVDRE